MSTRPTHYLTNRHGLQIAAYITEPRDEVVGTVVMAHGLSSSSNRTLFTETAPTFLAAGYRVVRYDATHSLGASAGDPQYCTMTSLYEDFMDMVQWTKITYEGNLGKLVFMGHSLGAMAIGMKVADAYIFVSAVTDGAKSFDYSWTPEELQDWQLKGYVERGRGDGTHRVRWSHHSDRCTYTILGNSYPNSLLISGTEDADGPGTNDLEQTLKKNDDGYVRLDIEGCGHSIRKSEHLDQVNTAIAAFIETV